MDDHHKLDNLFIFFSFPSINNQICNRIWTLGSMNLFILLMLAITVDIVITNQNSETKNYGFPFTCMFLQVLSNLGFIILFVPSTREQML
jgi:hypothetical protein